MGIGAVAMAAAIIALIQFGPWHGTKAASTVTPPKPVVQTPTPSPQQPTPAPVEATTPTPTATPEPAVVTPPAPKTAPTAAKPVRAQATPARANPEPIATPQPQQQPPQTATPLPQPATAPALAAPPAPSRELQETREQLVMLSARVTGIHTSLASLQRSQAASGLSLRGDMQTAASLMDSYMQGANSALNAGDVASAKSFLEKAEIQVERLEKFLNR